MSGVAYHPHRITPPSGIFTPLQQAELEQYRHSLNPLRTRPSKLPSLVCSGVSSIPSRPQTPPAYAPPSPVFISKAGRPHSPSLGTSRPLKRKLTGTATSGREPHRHCSSAAGVADHYNARPNTNISQRQDSPIIALKSFNNWIKSVLISKYAAGNTPAARTGKGPHGLKVLDLGCGKGGDLQKWAKAGTDDYVGLDVARVSVEQARTRHSDLRHGRFKAVFADLDCYEEDIGKALDSSHFTRPFDVVSMQFCMHYAFDSEKRVRVMLQNVSRYLDLGGHFVGTIPNSALLLERLHEVSPAVREFGNSVYQITFDDPTHQGTFGFRYHFYLKDAVDDVPEYVVFWDSFVQLASEYGLRPLFCEEFHQIYALEKEHPEYQRLLQRMKVIDHNGHSSMTPEQWEAANLYIAFAFIKVPLPSSSQ